MRACGVMIFDSTLSFGAPPCVSDTRDDARATDLMRTRVATADRLCSVTVPW